MRHTNQHPPIYIVFLQYSVSIRYIQTNHLIDLIKSGMSLLHLCDACRDDVAVVMRLTAVRFPSETQTAVSGAIVTTDERLYGHLFMKRSRHSLKALWADTEVETEKEGAKGAGGEVCSDPQSRLCINKH